MGADRVNIKCFRVAQRGRGAAGMKSRDYLLGQGGWHLLPPPTTGSLVGTAMNLLFFCQKPWSHICQVLEAVKVKNTPTVSRTRGYYCAAMLQLVMLCCSHLLPPVLPPARPSPPHPSAVWHCWSVRGTASPWRWSMLAPQANNPSFFNMAGAQGQHRRRFFFFFPSFWSK